MSAHDRVDWQRGQRARFYLGGVEVTEEQYREKYPLAREGRFYFLGGAMFSAAEHYALTEPDEKGTANGLVTFKPIASRSLAVHPSQVEEAREFFAKTDTPTDFLPDGRPVLTSSRHFRRFAVAQGFRHQGY